MAQLDEPRNPSPDVALENVRAGIALAGTRVAVIAGPVVVLVSVFASVVHKVYVIVVGDLLLYAAVVAAHFSPLSPRRRAAVLVAVFHAIGWMVLLALGPLSHGVMWLVAGTLLAAMLLGASAARKSIGMQIVALLATTALFRWPPATWLKGGPDLLTAWIAFAVFSVGLSALLSAPLVKLLDGFAKELVRVRALEAQLIRSERLESLGALAAGIAHDFSNLLQPILSFAEMATSSLESNHPAAADVAEIERATRTASDLVRQMLSLGRPASVARAPLHVSQFVQEQQPLLRASLPRRITIELDLASSDDLIDSSAAELQQVLVNLTVNAAHAIGENSGSVRICTRGCAPNDVPSTLRDVGAGFVRIDVTDTGCGMSDETMNRIFEPFFTTRAPGVGTGLGLATVHRIVSSMGGAVLVRSTPGRGSTFSLVVPRVAPGGSVTLSPGAAAVRTRATTVTTPKEHR